jgi:hypothetical protein
MMELAHASPVGSLVCTAISQWANVVDDHTGAVLVDPACPDAFAADRLFSQDLLADLHPPSTADSVG